MGSSAAVKKESNVRRVEDIPISLIKPNPYQPRKKFSVRALEELSQSIDEYGLIHPIIIREIKGGEYELVAGERRLRATKMLGMKTISSIVVESVDRDSAMLAMIENLQRENLHFIEEAKGYESLIMDHGFTQENLAKKLGKSQSTIANKLRILRLRDDLKNTIIKEDLTERHARALLRLPSDEMRKNVLDRIIKKGLNVKETDHMVDNIINREEAKKANGSKTFINVNKDFRLFVNTIKEAVNVIKKYGLDPEYVEIEDEEYVEVTIRIQKG
ncbi:MAG: nucleoid occlusion protein [Clostridiales bacterium]|nr:nucleoid occlusion protein [Clostridiales bacterium]